MKKGKFIVLEGLDGSGKTTQLQLLSKHLTSLNIPNILTKEPTSSNIIGLAIREVLTNKTKVSDEALSMLFAADRYEHIISEILPALEKGMYVLCDRYYFSNFAYQSTAVSMERLIKYNEKAMQLLKPDIVLFLDMEPSQCIKRINERQNELKEKKEKFETLNILTEVRRNFFLAFEALKQRENIAVLDANGLNEQEVLKILLNQIF